MKRAHLRFGKGFHVAMSNRRAQVATMTLTNGDSEGDSANRHRGADQCLFVVRGTGTARVNGKAYPLRPGTMVLIEHGDRHEMIAGRGRAPGRIAPRGGPGWRRSPPPSRRPTPPGAKSCRERSHSR